MLRSDVHQVAEHIVAPVQEEEPTSAPSPSPNWAARRKASPAQTLLASTKRWIAGLPFEGKPTALAAAYPRIANALAALWARPDEFRAYLDELLVDRRGGREGFPVDVLEDLTLLGTYYATLHPDRSVPEENP
jgi:hypothetical protein